MTPLFLVVVGVQMGVAAALGAPFADPAARVALLDSSPLAYLVIAYLGSLVTLIAYGAAEAGLSATLYRGLRAPV